MQVTRGYVYSANLGNHHNSLQNGTRPILVVSNNMCNTFSDIVTVVPITSKTKTELPTHIHFKNQEGQENLILCEQPMSISKHKIFRRLFQLSQRDMKKVDEGLRIQLDI